MKCIILLNGPPRCGKDTLANHFQQTHGFIHVKFANEVKTITHRIYDTPNKAADAYEDVKDKPHPDFLGITPRQAYIHTSEEIFKPLHGVDFFGLQIIPTIKRVAYNPNNVFVISDCGFTAEVLPLRKSFETAKILLLQIERNGCTFEGDSRSYIDPTEITKHWTRIENNGTPEEFIEQAARTLEEMLPTIFTELS